LGRGQDRRRRRGAGGQRREGRGCRRRDWRLAEDAGRDEPELGNSKVAILAGMFTGPISLLFPVYAHDEAGSPVLSFFVFFIFIFLCFFCHDTWFSFFFLFLIFLLTIFIIINLVMNNHFYLYRSTCEAFCRLGINVCKCMIIHIFEPSLNLCANAM
jgi:hypothetical protein